MAKNFIGSGVLFHRYNIWLYQELMSSIGEYRLSFKTNTIKGGFPQGELKLLLLLSY